MEPLPHSSVIHRVVPINTGSVYTEPTLSPYTGSHFTDEDPVSTHYTINPIHWP